MRMDQRLIQLIQVTENSVRGYTKNKNKHKQGKTKHFRYERMKRNY